MMAERAGVICPLKHGLAQRRVPPSFLIRTFCTLSRSPRALAFGGVLPFTSQVPAAYVVGIGCLALAFLVNKLSSGPSQPCEGAVFITGCDSGMGEVRPAPRSSLQYDRLLCALSSDGHLSFATTLVRCPSLG